MKLDLEYVTHVQNHLLYKIDHLHLSVDFLTTAFRLDGNAIKYRRQIDRLGLMNPELPLVLDLTSCFLWIR